MSGNTVSSNSVLGRVDLRGQAPTRMPAADLAALLPRATLDVGAAIDQVRPVCDDVRKRGAAAVREYSVRFDSVDLESTVVPQEALAAALADLDPAVRAALTEAARRARLVHQAQRPAETWTAVASGSTVTSLARGDMHAVEAVVPKRGVNRLIPALKAAGGRDILEIPISKIVE